MNKITIQDTQWHKLDNLEDDKEYLFQNLGSYAVEIREGDTVDYGFIINSLQFYDFKKSSDVDLFVRTMGHVQYSYIISERV